jgi:alanine-glyoxylate transaminase/serine-glyoxylate transaminase/serine-pyruvate transaminase
MRERQSELLMIPGPVPLSPAVLAALASPPRPHYGDDWTAVWNGNLAMLARIFGTAGTVLNIPGSGSAGLDAAIGSVVGPGDRALVSVNGYHGNRLAYIAKGRGAEVEPIDAPWGEIVTAAQFADAARRGRAPKAFIATHVETTTGVINPVAEIAAEARRAGALMVVDAVASLGGTDMQMDAWGIDVCCASSQKCLGSTPGLAQIAVSDRVAETIRARPDSSQPWYLDLKVWLDFHDKWKTWHPYPVTVPTGTTLALAQALKELTADGLEHRFAHYRGVGAYLARRLADLGMERLTADAAAAPVISAVKVREGQSADALLNHLRDRHGIHVGAGFGQLADRVIRVGHMSPRIGFAEIDALAEGIRDFGR